MQQNIRHKNRYLPTSEIGPSGPLQSTNRSLGQQEKKLFLKKRKSSLSLQRKKNIRERPLTFIFPRGHLRSLKSQHYLYADSKGHDASKTHSSLSMPLSFSYESISTPKSQTRDTSITILETPELEGNIIGLQLNSPISPLEAIFEEEEVVAIIISLLEAKGGTPQVLHLKPLSRRTTTLRFNSTAPFHCWEFLSSRRLKTPLHSHHRPLNTSHANSNTPKLRQSTEDSTTINKYPASAT